MPEGVDGGTSATDTNAAIGATSTSAMSDMDSIKEQKIIFHELLVIWAIQLLKINQRLLFYFKI